MSSFFYLAADCTKTYYAVSIPSVSVRPSVTFVHCVKTPTKPIIYIYSSSIYSHAHDRKIPLQPLIHYTMPALYKFGSNYII